MNGATRPTVSLVFGAYDEAERLPDLLEHLRGGAEAEIRAAGLEYEEAVIVDDGSTDGTAELLREASERDERIRPLFPWVRNRGKGAALRAGVEVARGDLVLLVDVDLSTPLRETAKLEAARARGDRPIAIGSRALGGSLVVAPLHRRVLGGCFNFVVRRLTGLGLPDTQSGFKLLEREVAHDLMSQQASDGFAYDVELLVRAGMAGVPVVEVPVDYVHDSRSRVRLVRSGLRMLRDVALMSVRLRRASGPRSGGSAPASKPSATGDRTESSSDRP